MLFNISLVYRFGYALSDMKSLSEKACIFKLYIFKLYF